MARIKTDGSMTVEQAGRELTVRRAIIDGPTGQYQTERINNLRRPLMVLHAPRDDTEDSGNAR